MELDAASRGTFGEAISGERGKPLSDIARGRGPRAVIKGLTNAIVISIGLWMALYGLAVLVF